MDRLKDPMGAAIADYFKNGIAGRLRVFSPDFEEDEIPVDTLFRPFDEMPRIEQKALSLASGKIIDVGAGAGCHSLALQDMDKDVTAIDISPLSVETMKARGVEKAEFLDFYAVTEKYDTILMLMNGIGIAGRIEKLPEFFSQIDRMLAPNGQLLIDSSDICYLFEDEDGIIELPDQDNYYGELEYQMQYKRTKGDSFPWLFIDFDTLSSIAEDNGFDATLIDEGEHYEYLAKITRKHP